MQYTKLVYNLDNGKTPPNMNSNSIYEIQLDRKLPPGIIPLNITHNLNHIHPSELLISLLDISNKKVKIPENTILGSIIPINDVDTIQEVSWKKIQDAENKAVSNTTQDHQVPNYSPLSPKILIFRFTPMIIASQPLCYKMQTFHKLQEIS